MDPIFIKLGDVTDSTGRLMSASILKSKVDTTKHVIAFGESRRDQYYLSAVIESALRDDSMPFIVADGWDGSTDYVIPHSEIRKLARQIVSGQLVEDGCFEVDVNFVASDPNCPF